jgi:energy-coupling factor transporter ATP-binding protein EcfA2
MTARRCDEAATRRGAEALRHRTVLDRLSLDVDDVAGDLPDRRSGSGKSTLLRCVNLLEPIDDGRSCSTVTTSVEPGRDPDPCGAGSGSCSRASTCSRT